jgi:hypothetical protein
MENNGLKLGFKLGLIIRLTKGVGINPLTINLSFITLDIIDHLIYIEINEELNKGSNYLLVEIIFRHRLEQEKELTRRLFRKINKEIFYNIL